LWTLFGWGWYLSMLGTVLTLLGAFYRDTKPGVHLNLNSLSERKLS
jgi:hypothetical protein